MSVNGRLEIQINVICPYCGEETNLLDIDSKYNEWVYEIVMPTNSHWSGACRNFTREYLNNFGNDFKCPECDKDIYIREIWY